MTDLPETFLSELGCNVTVSPAPEHMPANGVLLNLHMPYPDLRSAQVFLSRANMASLRRALEAYEEALS